MNTFSPLISIQPDTPISVNRHAAAHLRNPTPASVVRPRSQAGQAAKSGRTGREVRPRRQAAKSGREYKQGTPMLFPLFQPILIPQHLHFRGPRPLSIHGRHF
ncbi:hypothetical protein E6O75_ATG09025 [Venturia nashicola]|uniref:Uncharacterized protein n=1 Tax=Venturia nashicola TaxID=86259 RepID=A0A4Z1NS02_9PEZI|nr:hypothetical protein E6O75_ATG09025 [Venturia nashicola]